MIYNENRYSTIKYKRCQRRNNSVIQTIDNTYGIISKICKIKCNDNFKVFIFFYRVKIANNFVIDNLDVTHFKVVLAQEKMYLNVIEYSMLHRPCILLKLRKQFFIITLVKGVLERYVN